MGGGKTVKLWKEVFNYCCLCKRNIHTSFTKFSKNVCLSTKTNTVDLCLRMHVQRIRNNPSTLSPLYFPSTLQEGSHFLIVSLSANNSYFIYSIPSLFYSLPCLEQLIKHSAQILFHIKGSLKNFFFLMLKLYSKNINFLLMNF